MTTRELAASRAGSRGLAWLTSAHCSGCGLGGYPFSFPHGHPPPTDNPPCPRSTRANVVSRCAPPDTKSLLN